MEGDQEGTMDGGRQIKDVSVFREQGAATVNEPVAASDPRLAWSRHTPKSA